MASQDPGAAGAALADDLVLLFNRATVVAHTVRTTAHELNNVLQTISGSAELLDGAPSLEAKQRRRIESILRQAARGQALVARVADLARPQGSGVRVLDLGSAVAWVLDARRYEHHRTGIAVTSEIAQGTPLLVRAEPRDVHLMLLNLVINAEQAVGERPGGTIRIEITPVAGFHKIVVSDNGPGVEGGELFAPLVTTRPLGQAAGLGLTATRLMAARCGGSLELHARAGGTDAVLTLPAAASSHGS